MSDKHELGHDGAVLFNVVIGIVAAGIGAYVGAFARTTFRPAPATD